MNSQYIYIVEDDTNIGNIYQRTLEHAGYRIYLNRDGKNLLAELQKQPPDLLILDLHVPYSWGPETIEKIRAISGCGANLKILVTTADLMAGRDLIAAGETVLIKPVSIMRLQEVVEKMLAE